MILADLRVEGRKLAGRETRIRATSFATVRIPEQGERDSGTRVNAVLGGEHEFRAEAEHFCRTPEQRSPSSRNRFLGERGWT
ncbi:MAG: hypothetical protein JWN34_1386 [Bryobacterales bacterium]|nr:hypothetical protein [Bryobacterales bacterium]